MASQRLSGRELVCWRRSQLNDGGRAVDLDWLLDLAGGLRWTALQQLIIDPDRSVELEQSLAQLASLWQRHLADQVPLQYLIGRCPWRDFELEVSPAALIPRQETELLVDFALDACSGCASGRWADLGTGSGALAVALARGLPDWDGHAVDCSAAALKLADRNLRRLAPHGRWQLHCGHWWEPLRPWWGAFNVVVCNPPYIPAAVLEQLDPVVRNHEPQLALHGGSDGLASTRQILAMASQALASSGLLLVEHHHDQSDAVLNLMALEGLIDVSCRCDLQGVKRFASARRSEHICL
ncbi:MAG: peptide chain release factor N(5)-glutamine methyltransferase [Prochlorococcus sp.]|nr:peptide chain release factor N(5)-glutamine methyltransferase [Prochlorococcaceae cyanobacterium Fu_MAG_50]